MESTSPLNYLSVWLMLGWGLILSIIYLSLDTHPPQIMSFQYVDKLGHTLAYATLMGWFTQFQFSSRQILRNALLFILLGVILEILQGIGGVRYFEYADMAANSSGVVLGWLLSGYVLRGWLAVMDRKLYARMTLEKSK
jgi:VanZ family protein